MMKTMRAVNQSAQTRQSVGLCNQKKMPDVKIQLKKKKSTFNSKFVNRTLARFTR